MENLHIKIENKQKALRLNPEAIKKLARKTLQLEGVSKAEVAFVFITRQKIQSLNKQFLKRAYATDVLAFDLRDKPKSPLQADIFISTDAAVRQAKGFKTTPAKELALYVVHGILHCCGYDDHTPVDVKRMRMREEEILAKIARFIKDSIA